MDEHSSHRNLLTQQTPQLNERAVRLEESYQSCNKELGDIQKKRHSVDAERKKLHQLELETNEKLENTMNILMQAKSDCQESNRSKKFKETLESLSRLFPGIHGKLIDLCKPTERKYDLAVSIILGRNIDAIGFYI
jgi:structural maintenance of chromosome 1